MARNYILGGMAATQLQAGKPFFKRIVRFGGAADAERADDFTCKIDDDGKIAFGELVGEGEAAAFQKVKSPGWQAGELLMVEFPTTMRNVEILLEEAWVAGELSDPGDGDIRCKIMLAAPGQDVKVPDAVLAQPINNGNYIEIRMGETATINSRQKVVFILIEKFASVAVAAGDNPPAPRATVLDVNNAAAPKLTEKALGDVLDAAAILITGVLDHEPTSGASNAAGEPTSTIVDVDGTERTLKKIWGNGEGIA